MSVKLNTIALEHARTLIQAGMFVADERELWSEHHPSTAMENEFIRANGFPQYSSWFLAINSRYEQQTRRYWEFPHGDFDRVHRCALLAAESGARERRYFEIELAARELVALIDSRDPTEPRSSRSVDPDAD